MLDWTQCSGEEMEATRGRKIWVEDGQAGHRANISATRTVQSALDDYVSDYDFGDWQGPIEATWHVYQDGVEVESGAFRFSRPAHSAAPAGE